MNYKQYVNCIFEKILICTKANEDFLFYTMSLLLKLSNVVISINIAHTARTISEKPRLVLFRNPET